MGEQPKTTTEAPPSQAPQRAGGLTFTRLPLDAIVAKPRPIGQSLIAGTWFAAEAVLCCATLYIAYAIADSPGVGWAIVSALLVLIPDAKQTVATALARVAANVIGAVVGLVVATSMGEGPLAVVLAVTLAGYACYLFRLDVGLRTACVAVVIVMTTHPGDIVMSSAERFVAVIAGCGVGVAVQLTVLSLQRKVKAPAPGTTTVGE